MLYTISWMVTSNSESSPSDFALLFTFLIGGAAGGLLLGLAVAAAARFLFLLIGSEAWSFALGASAVSLLALGSAVGMYRIRIPQLSHQVPEAWRSIFSPYVAGFIYSGALGAQVFTRLNSAVLYPLVIVALGLGQWPTVIIGTFALAGILRSSTSLILPLGGLYEQGSPIMDRVEKRLGAAKLVEALVLGLGGGVLAAISVVHLIGWGH